MKSRIFALLLSCLLLLFMLCGCNFRDMERKLDAMEDAVEQRFDPDPTQPSPAAGLTAEEVKAIALEHAGLTAEEVRFVKAEYDWDHGVPEYDIEFHSGGIEYEYEIHAETGQILSWEKDH